MRSASRPPVAVILPFYGGRAEAQSAADQLGRLRLRAGDELVLADNTEGHVASGVALAPSVRHLPCRVVRSAYAARNLGAERTSAPWLLFVDADCVLPPDLLERYFDPPPAPDVGAVAGEVRGVADQPGLVPAYVRSRHHLEQGELAAHPYRPMAVTANLLVRREAWERLGGFAEGTRSGADADFCWRLQDIGFSLALNRRAAVEHRHRDTVRALLSQARRDGAGGAWLARRHPAYPARLPPAFFLRAGAGALGWPLLLQPRRGLYKALDALWGTAFNLGSLESNDPVASSSGRRPRRA